MHVAFKSFTLTSLSSRESEGQCSCSCKHVKKHSITCEQTFSLMKLNKSSRKYVIIERTVGIVVILKHTMNPLSLSTCLCLPLRVLLHIIFLKFGMHSSDISGVNTLFWSPKGLINGLGSLG